MLDHTKPQRICVFTGSSSGNNPAYFEAATTLGQTLADNQIELVYGGAQVGLMGAVADAALEAGGRVIGVLPEHLARVEIAHEGLSELKIVSSMHERKAQMADLSNGFIAMPGGIGTLEECFEVWTWSQLGIHHKPIGLLNVDGFYDRLIEFLDQLVTAEFVKPVHRNMLLCHAKPAELIAQLSVAEVPNQEKWLDR